MSFFINVYTYACPYISDIACHLLAFIIHFYCVIISENPFNINCYNIRYVNIYWNVYNKLSLIYFDFFFKDLSEILKGNL